MTKQEERFLLKLEQSNKKARAYGWQKTEPERTELEIPADVVVIDRQTRAVESLIYPICGISNIKRLERLIEREEGQYGDSLVVAVEQRKFSLGDILQDKDIISLD